MEFVDPTNVCPLCKCITERDGDGGTEEEKLDVSVSSGERDKKNPAGAEHLYVGGHYC